MPYFLAVYDWSLYTLPGAIPFSDIEGDTHSNDPASPVYDAGQPEWIGETFTYNGGSSTLLEISDDDANFDDGYVDTGTSQTLAQNVTINGVNFFAGDSVENEFSMLDSSGNEIWVVRIDGVNVGFAYPAGADPTIGQTFVGATGRDGAPADSTDGQSSSEAYQSIICFTKGVLIETPSGLCAVETLRVGDLVTTVDRGAQPICWVSRRFVRFNDGLENAKPIQIAAGAFAPGLPNRTLAVSPQHRFVFDRRDTATSGVLVAAKALTVLPGVRVMQGKKSVEYFHIALARHHIIVAEGVQTESCYLGPVFLSDVPRYDRSSMRKIFPGLTFDPIRGYGPTARPVVKVQQARDMLRRGQLNYERCHGALTA